MKIAVPWPVRPSSQPRIRESLSLWDNCNDLFVCMVSECDDLFLQDYETFVVPRNTTLIGTKVAKCFIYDMVKAIRDKYPDEDYYGFSNSDCVAVGDFIESRRHFEVLVYHRTEIKDWSYRLAKSDTDDLDAKTTEYVRSLREQCSDDHKVARHLNIEGVKVPDGHAEWTYDLIRKVFEKQGSIFFWGQDMYLFRNDVVDRVLEEYLRIKDPIIGTGGFDPRLTKWCFDHFKSTRVFNKLFHREHASEWNVDEVEYLHNGGDIELEDRPVYYDRLLVESLVQSGNRGVVPKYIKYMIGRENPDLFDDLFDI